MRRLVRPLLKAAAFALVCGLIWVWSATFAVKRSARGRTFSDVTAIPKRRVGLVLGCSRKLADGRLNAFFANRIEAAARLYRAGKVEYLVVSGDNHTRSYDEPQDMKDSLVAAGVPSDRIFCDYAGFRTLDSVVRVREIFDQRVITIVSQEFHNERAIFIARHRGVDAIGFNAAEVDAHHSFLTRTRELRVNTLLDIYVFRRAPRYLGQKVVIPA